MSSKSVQSCANTAVSHGANICGFPEKCVCGLDAVIYTAKTQDNPGRPFFRCPTRKEDHLFKWVEDAVYEELVNALPKLEGLAIEIRKSKCEVEEMKSVIAELKEEMGTCILSIQKCNKMLKLCLVFLCLITVTFLAMILTVKGKDEGTSYKI